VFDGKYLEWNQKRIKCIIDYYGHNFMYGKSLLDLGCGQADIGGAMYRLGADVTAVDSRQEHLTTASKKFPGIKTVKADLERGWPFQGRKFDVALDLALLCHLRDWDVHLKDVCSSCRYLILETAVCDSADPNKCIIIKESKFIYDNSANGFSARPSAAAVEQVLAGCGFSFKRMDTAKLNAQSFVYDWQPKNDDGTDINYRRLWFAEKINPPAPEHTVSRNPHSPYEGGSIGGNHPQSPYEIKNSNQPAHKPLQAAIPRPPVPYTPPEEQIALSHIPANIPPIVFTNDSVKNNSKKFAILPGVPIPQYPDLKVLYLPLNDADNVQQGMYDAWANVGVQLKVFDFYRMFLNHRDVAAINQNFLDQVGKFKPNLIHMQLQMTGIISVDSLMTARRLSPGVIITNWSGDIRAHVIHEMNIMRSGVDLTLISNTGQLGLYKQAGVNNAAYWQVGYNPKQSHPLNHTEFDYDVSFIANNYGTIFPDSKLRAAAVDVCTKNFGSRFGIFGAGWPNNPRSVNPSQINEIYNKSISTLSISNFNSVAHYFSDRLLSCVASGRPTIAWHFPGAENYFVGGSEILYARNYQEIVNHVNFCKANPQEAIKIGLAGAKKALEEHTFTSRVLELLFMTKLADKI
jgi:SAM-dependent methyltransferase